MIIDKEKNQQTVPFFLPPPLSLLPHRIICIRYNDSTPLRCSSPPRLFVFDTTILFPHPWSPPTGHQQHHLYLIQRPVSTSMIAVNRIVCIWYNVPHPWSPLQWSFVFYTIILLYIKLPHYHDHSYSIQWSSGHHDASSTPCTHPHRPTMRSWPWADFSTYAWLWCHLTSSSPTTQQTW